MICKKPIGMMKGSVHVSFPCGRCLSCRLNMSSNWAQRLMAERRYHEEACFVTLTYNDESIPNGWNFDKSHCQKFLKSIRKRTGKKVRFFLSSEYGDKNGRPHYHAILFGVGVGDINSLEAAWSDKGRSRGFVTVYTVNRERCNYVAKYTTKKLMGESASYYKEAGVTPEFCLSSRRPGIGADYVKEFGHEFGTRGYLVCKGSKHPIPRYFKKRLAIDDPVALQNLAEKTDEYLREKNVDLREDLKLYGYKKIDERTVLSQEAAANNVLGRESMKRRKL